MKWSPARTRDSTTAKPVAVRQALDLLGSVHQRAVESERIAANPVRLVRRARLPRRKGVRPLAPSDAVLCPRLRRPSARRGARAPVAGHPGENHPGRAGTVSRRRGGHQDDGAPHRPASRATACRSCGLRPAGRGGTSPCSPTIAAVRGARRHISHGVGGGSTTRVPRRASTRPRRTPSATASPACSFTRAAASSTSLASSDTTPA